ncbi:MAG TPA: hypothetical protein VH682_09940 [Gemmataceae bacterium]|jgi:hypothetical protein
MAQSESRQSSNLLWVVLAGILGVFALGGPKSSTETSKSTIGKESKEGREEGSQPIVNGEGPLDPRDDFFALDRRRRQPFTDNKDSERLDGYKWEYLIVTVPDPVDSQFGFAFDQLMDSTQRALETQGYVLDRTWLPWEVDKQKREKLKIVATRKQLAGAGCPQWMDVEKDKASSHHRDQDPGVLLFRRYPKQDQPKDELFIVLLVGETPTSGIHKRAFTRALEMMREHPATPVSQDLPVLASIVGLMGSPQGPRAFQAASVYLAKPQKIRVVGPYFTGSQTSMRLAMYDPPLPPDSTFEVISGGAMAVDQKLFCSKSCAGKNNTNINFRATIIPAAQVLRATLHYLAKRDRSDSKDDDASFDQSVAQETALLVESNTSYGRRSGSESARDILQLYFPLHIAGLRVQYDEAQRRIEEQLGLSSFDALVPRLNQMSARTQDTIPSQDPATTTSINGEVLKDLLSIISRHRKRYVGIIATDPRDQVFLARAVRQHCPGVQVFILDNDQMLTLPEYAYYLKGTILGSTYPLLPENQFWTDPRKKDHLCFQNQAAQGYYNAILAHLVEEGKSSAVNDMIEYGPPSLAKGPITFRPPVWITMIGQNGDLVPLQFFTDLGEAKGYVWPEIEQSQPGEQITLRFPATILLTLLLLLALGGYVACHAFLPETLLFWKSSDSSWRHWIEAFFYRFFGMASLIILLIPFVFLYWLADLGIPNPTGWESMEKFLLWLSRVLLVVLATALLTPILYLFKTKSVPATAEAARPAQGKGKGGLRAIGTFFCQWGLLILILIALFLFIFWYATAQWRSLSVKDSLTSWQTMFFERAFNVATGVSPLLPLIFICLTLFLWCSFQLRRMHLAGRFAVSNPFPEDSVGSYSFRDITRMHGALQKEMQSWLEFVKGHWTGVIFVLAIVFLGAWRIGDLFLTTAEGFLWSWPFFAAFSIGFFLVAANVLRFWMLWSRLKKLLGEIALLPMARAFNQLPQKVRLAFAGYLPPKRAHLSEMRLPYHQLELLRTETGQLQKDPELKDDPQLRDIKTKLDTFKAEEDFPAGSEDNPGKKLGDKLSGLTQVLLPFLTKFWPKHSIKEAFGDHGDMKELGGAGGAATGQTDRQRWVALAEDLVAIQIVVYLSQFFIQMRNLIWSMILCGTLLLLGSTSYPFQPERLLVTLLLTLIGAILAGIVYVLVQMSRNELLSRIARTPLHRFSLDGEFVSSIFTYVVPLGTIVVLQMSGAFRFLLEPLVRMLR